LAMTKGFGPVSAEYADKLVKDGKLAGGTPPAGKLPSGVPSMPSLKDVLNPTKSNLGPVSNKPAAGATAGAKSAGTVGKPNNYTFPSIKDILNPPQSNLGPVGGKKPSGTAAPVAGTVVTPAAGTASGTAAPAVKPQQPYSLTDVAKGGYLRSGMKGVVVRDMQELIKNNFPEIEIDLNGVFNQQTLDAVIKVQKMLGVKPKNGKYGIFGPITIGAINKSKTSRTTQTPKLDPKTGLPDNSLGLPKFNPDLKRFEKYNVSTAQQAGDLQKLGLQEDLIKKIVSKHLHSKL